MNGMMPQQNDYFPAHREMIPKLPAPPIKKQVIYKVNPPGMQLVLIALLYFFFYYIDFLLNFF